MALAAACAGERQPELLTADELVARAHEAMTKESFALIHAMSSVPSVEYDAPDLMLITTDSEDDWPYIFVAGRETYTSETGRQWRISPGTDGQHWRLSSDPRELLRIATDVRDEGIQDLGGKPHRVVTARPDIAKFADKYLTAELMLTVQVLDHQCPGCSLTFDRQRLEELGYRMPGGVMFKGRDIQIKAYPEKVMFWVQGVRELTPALKDEFQEVLKAYSIDPDLLDTAQVSIHDSTEWAASHASDEGRFWIDLETFLVSKMELDWGTGTFVDYGDVELPKPQPAVLDKEADILSGQVTWQPLGEALECYAGSHDGLYPDEVTPAVLEDALESEGLEWPQNPFTGEPMEESPEGNPGDFHYEPWPDRLDYCAEVYLWDETRWYMHAGVRPSDSPCPTPTPSSP